MMIASALAIAVLLATLGQRRRARRRAAHDRLGRLALPPPGPTPYQQALAGYLDALDRSAELRAERRRRRALPAPSTLVELVTEVEYAGTLDSGSWHDDNVGRPPAPTSMPSRGVPRSG